MAEEKKYSLQEIKGFQDIFSPSIEKDAQGNPIPVEETQKRLNQPEMIEGTGLPKYTPPDISEKSRADLQKRSEEFNKAQPQTTEVKAPTKPAVMDTTTTQPSVKSQSLKVTKPLSKFQPTLEATTKSGLQSVEQASDKKQEISQRKQQLQAQQANFLQNSQEQINQIVERNALKAEQNLNELNMAIERLKEFRYDTNRYFNSMSTSRKIVSALALFFSGIGNDEQTYNFIMKQLDLDIEAQTQAKQGLVSNVELAKGLYQLTLDSGKSQLEALYMVRQMQTDFVNAKIAELDSEYEASDEVNRYNRDTLKMKMLGEHGKTEKMYAESFVKMNSEKEKNKLIKDGLKMQKDVLDIRDKEQKYQQKEDERSVVYGTGEEGEPLVFSAKDKESRKEADKSIKEYADYRSSVAFLKSAGEYLASGEAGVSERGFIQMLKQNDLVAKMLQRIQQTGGGNVSNYEQILLEAFEAFGWIKLKRTAPGQVLWSLTSPMASWSKKANTKNALTVINNTLRRMDDGIRNSIQSHVSPRDLGSFKQNFNKDNLLKSLGSKSKFRFIKDPEGKWIVEGE